MTAQAPSKPSPQLSSSRSWTFFSEKSMEYLTQRPGDMGELMLGGGLFQSGTDEIGVADDSKLNLTVGAYLGGILPMVFENEGSNLEQTKFQMLSTWTGIMGFTIDALPFVGRLDSVFSKRKVRGSGGSDGVSTSAAPGEWIAAGYNGEGMVNGWLCGVAVALMVLGKEDEERVASVGVPEGKVGDWLPSEYLLTRRRIEKASIYKLAELL
jgi:glycine/D-amino acid oxidase-like deaminating enzyme